MALASMVWLRKQRRDGVITAAGARVSALGDRKSAARLTGIVSLAQAKFAKIIGVTGIWRGVGVSAAADQLVAAFGRYGMKSLLVDASRVDFTPAADMRPHRTNFDLLDLCTSMTSDVAFVDLATGPYWPGPSRDEMRRVFDLATQKGYTIVADLPPVFENCGRPTRGLSAAGAACDLTFLVCLSGRINRKEMSDCVETCKIAGVKLGGLILNDWKLTGSALLEA